MTNEEVEIKYFPCILDPQYNNKFKIGVFHKSMNKARADEREKVIEEIEKWIKDNKDNIPIDGDYCNLVYLDDDTEDFGLLTKLNSLREAK